MALAAGANAVTAGSVAMMTERERVIVLMSTFHAGYKSVKRRINLDGIGNVNTEINRGITLTWRSPEVE